MEGNRDEVFKMQISKPLDDDTVTMAIFYLQFFVCVSTSEGRRRPEKIQLKINANSSG